MTRPEQGLILAAGRPEPIRTGIRLTAQIRMGERRMIDVLQSPVMQAVQEAGGAMSVIFHLPRHERQIVPCIFLQYCRSPKWGG